MTNKGISIHLYDGEIILNEKPVLVGDDLNPALLESSISRIEVSPEKFNIDFQQGTSISVSSEQHETSRIFEKGSDDLHYIYQNGVFTQEAE